MRRRFVQKKTGDLRETVPILLRILTGVLLVTHGLFLWGGMDDRDSSLNSHRDSVLF